MISRKVKKKKKILCGKKEIFVEIIEETVNSVSRCILWSHKKKQKKKNSEWQLPID